jgi:hypothetical protein
VRLRAWWLVFNARSTASSTTNGTCAGMRSLPSRQAMLGGIDVYCHSITCKCF